MDQRLRDKIEAVGAAIQLTTTKGTFSERDLSSAKSVRVSNVAVAEILRDSLVEAIDYEAVRQQDEDHGVVCTRSVKIVENENGSAVVTIAMTITGGAVREILDLVRGL